MSDGKEVLDMNLLDAFRKSKKASASVKFVLLGEIGKILSA